jgi:hypothetical protein
MHACMHTHIHMHVYTHVHACSAVAITSHQGTHLQPLPTWKLTPTTASPSSAADLSSLGASAGSQPYLSPSGQRACARRCEVGV